MNVVSTMTITLFTGQLHLRSHLVCPSSVETKSGTYK